LHCANVEDNEIASAETKAAIERNKVGEWLSIHVIDESMIRQISGRSVISMSIVDLADHYFSNIIKIDNTYWEKLCNIPQISRIVQNYRPSKMNESTSLIENPVFQRSMILRNSWMKS
jgi:hypothetical protein